MFSDQNGMSRENFKRWLFLHRYVLETFKEMFKLNWWMQYTDITLGCDRLSFSQINPDIYASVSFQKQG